MSSEVSNRKVIGVDIGNTAIKSAEFMQTELGEVRYWNSIDDLALAYRDSDYVVASVGTTSFKDKLKVVLSIDSNSRIPLKLDYDTPETLGSDRIAAAVGAYLLFPNTNILVIDGGTCITYDLVTADGVFQGGIISPGLETRYRAMNAFTKGLPLLEPKEISTDNLIGKSTTECMRIGAQKGLEFEINHLLESFNKKYDGLQVVMTGGLLPGFESKLKAPIFASSKIVLGGMHAIWKINEGI